MRKHWPDCRQIAVLCGRGNNGGDGYIVASAAIKSGITTRVFQTGEPNTEDALAACLEYQQLGGEFQDINGTIDFSEFDVVIDGLFGSGLKRDVDGMYLDIINKVQSSARQILALDIPSGLDADTGIARGKALRADVTVCFIAAKVGLLTGIGKDYCGVLEVDTLDIPKAAYGHVAEAAAVICPESLSADRLKRRLSAHKGSVGRVLIVGGNRTMEGALVMAGQAALRAGAGLVSTAAVPQSNESAAAGTPEIRKFKVPDAAGLKQLLEQTDVTGIGPGLGQDAWATDMLNEAFCHTAKLVVDADALNLLAKAPRKRLDWILTPHPGEAARLLGVSVREVENDRLGAVNKIAERFGAICVLKGAGTLVAGAGRTWLCDRGNPGMATGGSGDILTGVISALWAQGLTAEQAACLGVWLHAVAGDECAANGGQIGMVATDLLPAIRSNLNRLVYDVAR